MYICCQEEIRFHNLVIVVNLWKLVDVYVFLIFQSGKVFYCNCLWILTAKNKITIRKIWMCVVLCVKIFWKEWEGSVISFDISHKVQLQKLFLTFVNRNSALRGNQTTYYFYNIFCVIPIALKDGECVSKRYLLFCFQMHYHLFAMNLFFTEK